MKKTLIIVLLISGFILYLYNQSDQQPGNTQTIKGLPWQIERLPQGQSRVFGLVLGQATLADATSVLGQDNELAIISMLGEQGSLEAYYPRYMAGVITGKLILVAQIDQAQLQAMRQRAVSIDYTGSGAKKFKLHQDDMASVNALPIATITFIPSVQFDHEIILKRFGEPNQRIKANNNTEHYLYPDKGLDIILNQKGKEVLQYVAPAQFNRLTDALTNAQQGEPGSN